MDVLSQLLVDQLETECLAYVSDILIVDWAPRSPYTDRKDVFKAANF